MFQGLANVTTADDYFDAATLRLPGTLRILLQIANAAVFYQLDESEEGKGLWMAERFLTPTVGSLARRCSGIRFRNALAGSAAQVSCELADADELEGFDTLAPFTSTISPAGGVVVAQGVSRLPLASFPPASPTDEDMVELVVTSSVHWFLRYQAADGYWYFLGGPPLIAYTVNSETIPNGGLASFADVATVVSVTIPRLGDYDIVQTQRLDCSAGGGTMDTQLDVSGVQTGDVVRASYGTDRDSNILDQRLTGLATSAVVKPQWATNAANNAVGNRMLRVTPVRIQ